MDKVFKLKQDLIIKTSSSDVVFCVGTKVKIKKDLSTLDAVGISAITENSSLYIISLKKLKEVL